MLSDEVVDDNWDILMILEVSTILNSTFHNFIIVPISGRNYQKKEKREWQDLLEFDIESNKGKSVMR